MYDYPSVEKRAPHTTTVPPPFVPLEGRAKGLIQQLEGTAEDIHQYFVEMYRSEKYDVYWDREFMKVGPDRFYDFDLWKLHIPVKGFFRKGFILVSTNPLYRLAMILFIVIHTSSLLVQRPNIPRQSESAPAAMSYAIVVDRFLLFVFSVDLFVSLVAHCPERTIKSPFLMLDVVVLVVSFVLEVADPIGQTIRFAFALNALRPFRIVRRNQSMRNIILVIVRSSKTMFDVILLVLYLVVLFAFFALVMFSDGMHTRCHFIEPTSQDSILPSTTTPMTTTTTITTTTATTTAAMVSNASSSSGSSSDNSPSTSSMSTTTPTTTTTPITTTTSPPAPTTNASVLLVPWSETLPGGDYEEWGTVCNQEDSVISFDNLFTGCLPEFSCDKNSPEVTDYSGYGNAGLAMLTILQLITLENWSTAAMEVMDGFTLFSALFFIAVTSSGAFWALNLVLATITDAFSRFYAEDEQRLREEAELKVLQLGYDRDAEGEIEEVADEGTLTEKLLRDHVKRIQTGNEPAPDDSDDDSANQGSTSARQSKGGASALMLHHLHPELRRRIYDQEDTALKMGEAALEGRPFSIQEHIATKRGGGGAGGGVLGAAGNRKTKRGLSVGSARVSGEEAAAAKQLEDAIIAHPLLRSRWRAMVASFSKSSQLSLTHGIRSVPTREITKRFLDREHSIEDAEREGEETQDALRPPKSTDTALDRMYGRMGRYEDGDDEDPSSPGSPDSKHGRRPHAYNGLRINSNNNSSPNTSALSPIGAWGSPKKKYKVRVSSWKMDDNDSAVEMASDPLVDWMMPSDNRVSGGNWGGRGSYTAPNAIDMSTPPRGGGGAGAGLAGSFSGSPLLAGSVTFGSEEFYPSALKKSRGGKKKRSVQFQTRSVWDQGEKDSPNQRDGQSNSNNADAPFSLAIDDSSPDRSGSPIHPRRGRAPPPPASPLSPLRKPRKSPFLTDEDEALIKALTAGRRLLPNAMGMGRTADSIEDGSAFIEDDEETEVQSLRDHSYYEDRVFDADKVRSFFPDFTPYPHQAMAGYRQANALLSVEERPKELLKFESRNKNYKFIMDWRQELDFDAQCAEDHAKWVEEGEKLRDSTMPLNSAEEYSTLMIPTLLDNQYESSSDGSDSGDSVDRGTVPLQESEMDEDARKLRSLKRHERRKKSLAALDPHLTAEGRATLLTNNRRKRRAEETGGGSEGGSIMESLQSEGQVKPVELHKRAERLERLHQQLVRTAKGLKEDKEKEFLANQKRALEDRKRENAPKKDDLLGGRFGTKILFDVARQGGSHLRNVSNLSRQKLSRGRKVESEPRAAKLAEMDRNSDDSEMSLLIHKFEVREAERNDQKQKIARDPNVVRGSGKKRSGSGTKITLCEEVRQIVEGPDNGTDRGAGDESGGMGLFAKIAQMQEDAIEVRALERLIVKHWAEKMQLQAGQGAKQVKRQARRGVKINQRKAIPPQGRLWLVLRGNRYRRLFMGMVITNFLLLTTSHAGEPEQLTTFINIFCIVVDVFLLADCVARIVLMGLAKYASVTTKNFYAFLEHVVAWFALIDLILVATGLSPLAKAFRVIRIFRFMKDWYVMRQIINHVKSSIRYLLNLLILLGIFALVFTVSGWHIFSGQAPSMEFMTECNKIRDERSCMFEDNCVWVNPYQWLNGNNGLYDVMKQDAQEMYNAVDDAQSRRVRRNNITVTLTPTYDGSDIRTSLPTSIVSLPPGYNASIFFNQSDDVSFTCRQYKAWGDLGSDQRFHFKTFVSSFITIFNLITKDNWIDVTHRHMEFISPWSVIFFFTVLALMAYILTPLLIAILLVNFGKVSTGEELKVIPDAVLLDEAMLSAELMSKELAEIGKRLRLKDEDKSEKARMKKALQEAEEERRIQRAKMDTDQKVKRPLPGAKGTTRLEASLSLSPGGVPPTDGTKEGGTDGTAAGTAISKADARKFARFKAASAEAARLKRSQVRLWFQKQARRRTLLYRISSSLLKYIRGFCDRRDRAPQEPLQGRSLYLFAAHSAIRQFACRVVGGEYFPFEKTVYWITVAHCAVTPINEASVADPGTVFFIDFVSAACVVLSVVEILLRCVAFGGFRGSYTYLMEDAHRVENRFDAVTLMCSWISAILYLFDFPSQIVKGIATGLSAFRPLRIVVRSTPTTMVCQAVWFSLPAMLNVLAILSGATIIAGVVGMELFKGRFRVCSDGSDRNSAECIGDWFAGPSDTVYFFNTSQTSGFAPRVWRDPGDFSFDNIFVAFTSLVEISVGSQWSDAMFSAMDSPDEYGGSPRREQNVQGAAFFIVWVVFANFFLLNIFMGTVVDSFRRLRSKLSGDRFEADTDENVIRKILDTKAKKTLSVPKVPFYSAAVNETCFAIISSKVWSWLSILVMLANLAILFTVHYGASNQWSIAQFWSNFALGMILVLEVTLKIGIAGPKPFFEMGFNKLLTIIILFQFVEVIVYASSAAYRDFQWLRATWVLRIVLVAREVRGIRKNLKIGLKSLPAMANIGSLLILVFYMFAILGMACFGHVRMEPTSRSFLSKNLNFKTFPRAMFTLYRVATLDDYGDVVVFCGLSEPECSKAVGNCGSHTLSRIFFTTFVVFMAFVMLNLFIAVVLENFEESVLIPVELQDRQSDVEKFRLVWSKMDPSGINVIAARDFVPLLQQLPGPRARLLELHTRKKETEEFDLTDEQMERLATKYAFGLRGEDSRSYIASLRQLRVPVNIHYGPDGRATCQVLFNDALNVIGELLFHRKLTDERTQELEVALKEDASEYDLDYYMHHHYCVQVIETWWKERLDSVNRYATWSRFLAPLLKQLYDRNAGAVLGGGETEAPAKEGAAVVAKRNQMKTYGLVDLLKEVMIDPDEIKEEDMSWKHVITYAHSDGEGSDSDSDEDFVSPQGRRFDDNDNDEGSPHHSASTRSKPRGGATTGYPSSTRREKRQQPFVGEPKWILSEEAPNRPSRFMSTADRMADLQRQADEAERMPSRHGQLNGTFHMPTLDDVSSRKKREDEKWARSGLPESMRPKSAYQQQKISRPPRVLLPEECEPPEVWRAKLKYDNAELPAVKAAGASIFHAIREAKKQGLIGAGAVAGAKKAPAAGPGGKVVPRSGDAFDQAQQQRENEYIRRRDTKAKVKKALLAFSKRVKENQAVDDELRRPMFDTDATDYTYVPPTLDDIIRLNQTLAGALVLDEASEEYKRRHEDATLSKLFASDVDPVTQLRDEEREAIRPRTMGELFPNSLMAAREHRWSTATASPTARQGMLDGASRFVPLPTSQQHTFLQVPDSVKKLDAAVGDAMSPSSASSVGANSKRAKKTSSDWGGTVKSAKSSIFGMNEKSKNNNLKPGSEQHELDRLLGVMVLKKFARRWRERAGHSAKTKAFTSYLRTEEGDHPSPTGDGKMPPTSPSGTRGPPPIDPRDL